MVATGFEFPEVEISISSAGIVPTANDPVAISTEAASISGLPVSETTCANESPVDGMAAEEANDPEPLRLSSATPVQNPENYGGPGPFPAPSSAGAEGKKRAPNAPLQPNADTGSVPLFQVSRILMKRHDRVQLYKLVWSLGMTRAAKQLGIGSDTIRRVCKSLNIPHPSVGYRSKLAANRPVPPPPPLPPVQISETGEIVDIDVQTDISCVEASEALPPDSQEAEVEVSGGRSTLLTAFDDSKGQPLHAGIEGVEEPCTGSPYTDPVKLKADPDHGKEHRPAVSDVVPVRDVNVVAPDARKALHQVLASLISRYDRDRLFDEVWRSPMRTLAKSYKVSDVALLKACRRLYIPVPPMGYWAKLAANKPVEPRPILPLVEVVQRLPRRQGRVHSQGEIEEIMRRINLAVEEGASVRTACDEAQIDLETLRRWRKEKRSRNFDRGEP